MGFGDFVEIEEEGGDNDKGSYEDADESETFLAEVKVVDAFEDDGEGFEPDVEEAVDEGYVEVQEEDHGFGEVEGYRADERDEGDFFSGHRLRHDFGLAA